MFTAEVPKEPGNLVNVPKKESGNLVAVYEKALEAMTETLEPLTVKGQVGARENVEVKVDMHRSVVVLEG
tara:strand:- start:42 stop:251 length:210 start_codon:yes stop_codon:yes gene_type:complete